MSEHIIDKPVTLIGRSSKNDIALTSDRLVSRRHATLRFEGNGYVLIDEASANGTYIGESRLAPHKPYPLHDGAELRIGSNTFYFEMRQAEPAKMEEMPTMLVVGETQNAPVHANADSSSPRSLWQSSVFYPKLLGTGSWNALLIYAHLAGAISAVRQDAMRALQEIDYSSNQSSDAGGQTLLPDINITLIPEGEGMFFNPRRITLKGIKDWQRAIFRFVIRPELGAKVHACIISVYMGPLLLNRIEIPLEFARQEPEEWPRASENCTQVTIGSFQKIYLAYNYSDRTIAMACQRAARLLAAAMPYLGEVEALRLRQVRGHELEQKMAEADVFQLFWSARTARTPYMQYEWEHALALARPLVHPVYWEVPLPNPPATLDQASFFYVPLYTFS
ncbi:hypothetical protein KSX_19340 [Ktedonospora formicarum]|uniref:FHA domain-containing protein n=2 Tax=Ktedonospora formicarum TaxID=2778364 RepID=A0A8J3HXF4_9CHLR|nr:hypothetical protein KSX_19340 [Ktedonospora formicarum]